MSKFFLHENHDKQKKAQKVINDQTLFGKARKKGPLKNCNLNLQITSTASLPVPVPLSCVYFVNKTFKYLPFLIRVEDGRNFIAIVTIKAMITTMATIKIRIARNGLKLNCHTLSVR